MNDDWNSVNIFWYLGGGGGVLVLIKNLLDNRVTYVEWHRQLWKKGTNEIKQKKKPQGQGLY